MLIMVCKCYFGGKMLNRISKIDFLHRVGFAVSLLMHSAYSIINVPIEYDSQNAHKIILY